MDSTVEQSAYESFDFSLNVVADAEQVVYNENATTRLAKAAVESWKDSVAEGTAISETSPYAVTWKFVTGN